MRWFLAAVLLIGCVGCGEKGPTDAEKAAIYTAAKAELDEVRAKMKGFEDDMRKLRSTGQEPSPETMKEYYEVLEMLEKDSERIQKIMDENRPSQN